MSMNTILGVLTTLFGGFLQKQANDDFNEEEQRRLDEVIGGLEDQIQIQGDAIDENSQRQILAFAGELERIKSESGENLHNLVQGLRDRAELTLDNFRRFESGEIQNTQDVFAGLNSDRAEFERSIGLQNQDRRGILDRLNASNDTILQELQDRFDRNIGTLDTLTGQEREDTDETFDNLLARGQRDLQRRGLTGSTLLPNLQAGVAEGRADAQNRLSDRLARERINLDTRLSGDIASARRLLSDRTAALDFDLTGNAIRDRINLGTQRLAANERNALFGIGQREGLGRSRISLQDQTLMDFLLRRFQGEQGITGLTSQLSADNINRQFAADEEARQVGFGLNLDILNTLANFQNMPPSQNAFSQLGPLFFQMQLAEEQRRAQRDAQPSAFGSFLQGAAPGLGSAAGASIASAAANFI